MDKLYDKDELFDLVNDEQANIDLNRLYPLATDTDSEVRLLVAELLSRDRTLNSENTLLDLLKDEDELVRAEACDSLSYFTGAKVLDALMFSLKNDEAEIVRCYALQSYWDAYFNENKSLKKDDMASVLSEIFELEKSIQVKLVCAGFLYLCGHLDMLDYLLQELDNTDQYIRNTVMNSLVLISNEENIHNLQLKLKPYYHKESAEFVKKKIGAFLSYTDDMLDELKKSGNG